MKIIKMENKHISQLVEMFKELYQSESGGKYMPDINDLDTFMALKIASKSKNDICLIAMDQEKIIAFFWGYFQPYYFNRSKTVLTELLWNIQKNEKPFLRNRAFIMLIKEIEKYAQKNNINYLEVTPLSEYKITNKFLQKNNYIKKNIKFVKKIEVN
jgi:hypothetical protein